MKTWTLDTCGLLSLFVVHFMWCVLNLKTRKTVNICIIWRQQIKGLYAIGLCRPPSPGFPRRDGTMSWHFTFHFECSSCGPINPEKKKTKILLWSLYFFFIFSFSWILVIFRYPRPYMQGISAAVRLRLSLQLQWCVLSQLIRPFYCPYPYPCPRPCHCLEGSGS